MHALIRRRPVALIVAFVTLTGCSRATAGSSTPDAGASDRTTARTPADAAKTADAANTASAAGAAGELSEAEMEAIFRARMDSARMNYVPADVAFMNGMIHHHAQALEMAGLAPSHASSEQIQVLAARIINAQQDEIRLMQQWLRDRDQPAPEVHVMDGEVMVMGGAHGHAGMQMPGMLTEEQMAQLAEAHGLAFDRLFLEYMIQHHQGAVTMVHELFATDGAAQGDLVFKLASDVQVDQKTEIARMERMLASMPSASGSR